ncbi:hypothetical protein AVEN_238631-1 [Araneus ventricosus]|uniref:DUF4371 domain-containing protein n=1 Tax=Araneus ventricosus TaxID=182803 RepID=A0A4Y2QK92_ARAVE|nr:hypothetical protein AVEN_238631-1 [Araneus ventricosus]
MVENYQRTGFTKFYQTVKKLIGCGNVRKICELAVLFTKFKLFAHTQSESKSSLVRREGFSNWKKVGERLSGHEDSLNYKNCFCSWKNLEASLGKIEIYKDLQNEIEKEGSHWKAVL